MDERTLVASEVPTGASPSAPATASVASTEAPTISSTSAANESRPMAVSSETTVIQTETIIDSDSDLSEHGSDDPFNIFLKKNREDKTSSEKQVKAPKDDNKGTKRKAKKVGKSSKDEKQKKAKKSK